MSDGTSTNPLEAAANDQEQARTAVIALGVWLALTLAAVGLLLVGGDAISSLFV